MHVLARKLKWRLGRTVLGLYAAAYVQEESLVALRLTAADECRMTTEYYEVAVSPRDDIL